MVQIICLVAISWLLIWLFEKGNLSVLGLRPTKSRLTYAAILFIVTAICCSSGFFLRMYFGKEQFGLNPNLDSTLILNGTWQQIKSVLFEELICRGVGLYILIKILGPKWAIFISAMVFGLLHLKNVGDFTDIKQVLLVFFIPFAFGLVLAYSYARSFSLWLPIAMHLGWNLVQNFIFPGGNKEYTLFISTVQPLVTVSYFVFYLVYLFPKVAAIGIDFLIVKGHKQLEIVK